MPDKQDKVASSFFHERCYICNGYTFQPHVFLCPEHAWRQREGVRTEELSVPSHDTLDTWRDRPPLLDEECGERPDCTPLYFMRRYREWLIFMRGYYTVAREPDCLAVNLSTQAILRLVDVTLDDILDALEETRPLPFQTELAQFWGRAVSTGLDERLKAEHPGPMTSHSLLEAVRAAPFPVYGLFGRPLDLTLCSVNWGSTGYYCTHVGFIYSSQRYPEKRESFTLSSSEGKSWRNAVQRRTIQENPAFDPTVNFFEQTTRRRYGTQERADQITLREGTGIIAGTSFLGKLERRLSQTSANRKYAHDLVFSFLGEETVLNGGASGPTEEQLLEVLEQLVVVNQRDDILAQHQRELDAETERLFGKG